MQHRSLTLDVVSVRTPCTADWDAMQGAGPTRFCTHCSKNVHNLSEMTQSDAERLVCESAGKLCIRFARADDGHMITLDYQHTKPKRRKFWGALSALTSLLGLFACYLFAGDRRTSRLISVQGEMTCPPVVAPATKPAAQTKMLMGDMKAPATQPTPTTSPSAAK